MRRISSNSISTGLSIQKIKSSTYRGRIQKCYEPCNSPKRLVHTLSNKFREQSLVYIAASSSHYGTKFTDWDRLSLKGLKERRKSAQHVHSLVPIQLELFTSLASKSRYYSNTTFNYKDNLSNVEKSNLNAENLPLPPSTEDQEERKSNQTAQQSVANGAEISKPSEPSIHNISYLPKYLHPYAHLSRLDKPIGTYLLLHPCLWSTALASPLGTFPDLKLCALFATGAFVMRGAGCTINDMWDANYDREVERTKSRPLASGALGYKEATVWLGLQLAAGLGVLVSLPNVEECFKWGVASLPLVVTYPLMKRYTNYPQLILGMTFNWGAIMGWVSVRGFVEWSVVGPLYLSGVAWTLVYDTLYAHQDKKDDAKLGLKSTALTFGVNTKPILSALAAVAWVGWMTAGHNCGFPWDAPYYYVGCSMATAHLLWQVQSADLNNAENLAYRFRSNNLVGWVIFGSSAVGNVMAC